MYSVAWKYRKDAPSRTVAPRNHSSCLRWPALSAWCAIVTVTPDDSRISVLSSGSPHAGTVWKWPPIEAGPQQRVGGDAVAFAVEPGHGVLARVEQRAEERREEHHLGEDEPQHPHAERGVDLLVVVAAQRLVDDVAEPLEQDRQQQREAGEERRTPPAELIEPA